MKPRTRPISSGFTLFEMLVAVALFALMAVLAYGGLDRVMAARQVVDEEASRWRDMEALFSRMQADLDASLERPVRNVFGVTEPTVKGEQALVGEDAANLWLVRSTVNGPPRRIGYRLKDKKLELLEWDFLDAGPRSRPKIYPLIEGISGFDIRYWDASGWIATWPRSGNIAERPRALEVTITFENKVSAKRVLLFP